jgi:beta-alanine--pyruvate transaminase
LFDLSAIAISPELAENRGGRSSRPALCHYGRKRIFDRRKFKERTMPTGTAATIPNDLEAFWLPFTPNRAFKAAPRLIARAKDMHYFTTDGRTVLDGTAGLWCINAGHNRDPIVNAIRAQAAELDYVPPFQFAHPKAFELASRVAALAPGDLDHVFFCNSGSEAVDTALKIALAYHNVRGEGARTRLIGRERGYHGVGFGGISVGGIVSNRKFFGTLLAGVDHLPATYNREHQAFTKGEPEWGAHLADELERIVALHDASTIAAVIVEPMAGSTGVLPAPKGYLQRLRAICDKHRLLLIFDEVITGFGRLGHAFAAERYGVVPDMISFAKGITSGTVPMGGVIVRKPIYDAFMRGPEHVVELFHGYTYSAHPLACAAALATLDLYREEGLFARAKALEARFADAALSLKGLPNVLDIRTVGLTAGIDLAARPDAPGRRAYDAMVEAFGHENLMIRITGDTLALTPPLIVSEAEIDEIFERVGRVIRTVA